MGTRSLTRVFTANRPTLALFGMWDGYPTGVGTDIVNFLLSKRFVNGISLGEEALIFNGPGCFTAQLVAHLMQGKPEARSGWYIVPFDDGPQEFNYDIYLPDWLDQGSVPIRIVCVAYGERIYDGGPRDFLPWAKAYRGE